MAKLACLLLTLLFASALAAPGPSCPATVKAATTSTDALAGPAIHAAAAACDAPRVACLLRAKVDPNTPRAPGASTPLHTAVSRIVQLRSGQAPLTDVMVSTVRLLVAGGADVNRGSPLLSLLAVAGPRDGTDARMLQLVTILVDAGASSKDALHQLAAAPGVLRASTCRSPYVLSLVNFLRLKGAQPASVHPSSGKPLTCARPTRATCNVPAYAREQLAQQDNADIARACPELWRLLGGSAAAKVDDAHAPPMAKVFDLQRAG